MARFLFLLMMLIVGIAPLDAADKSNWLTQEGLPNPTALEAGFRPYQNRANEFFLQRYAQESASDICQKSLNELYLQFVVINNSDDYSLVDKLDEAFKSCPEISIQDDILWQGMLLLKKAYTSSEKILTMDQELNALKARIQTPLDQFLYDMTLVNMHIRNAQYLSAISQALKLEFELSRHQVPEAIEISNLWSLGYLYSEIMDVSQSLIYYEKAYKAAIDAGPEYPIDISATYYNQAMMLAQNEATNIQNSALIIDLYKSLNSFYEQTGLTQDIYYTLYGMGAFYLKVKDYENCIAATSKAINNYSDYMSETYQVFSKELLALCLVKVGKTDQAVALFKEIYTRSKEMYRQHYLEQTSWRNLLEAEISFAQGDYKKAYHQYERYSEETIKFLRNQSAEQLRLQQGITLEMMKRFANQDILDQAARKETRIIIVASILIGALMLTGMALLILKNRQLQESETRASEASIAKSHFIANMSHELRTPLNAIIGFSEMTFRESYGPIGHGKYKEYAALIHDSGHHLLDVISEILDLSKLEAGKLTLHETKVSLPSVFQQVQDFMTTHLEKKSQKLSVVFDPDLPTLVADEKLLKQILLNLLSNAVKFTPKEGHITLEADYLPGKGHQMRVIDTGIGMTKEQIALAFEPFGQVQSVYGRTHQGTGLGLPLVQKFVELHGGTIDITSEPDVGTTVTVFIPKRLAPLAT